MFVYWQESVVIRVEDFKLIAVEITPLAAGRQRRVGRQSPEKTGYQQAFEMVQMELVFVTWRGRMLYGRRKTVHSL